MDLVMGLGPLSDRNDPTAVTVGFFDGVHRGHQAVLGRAVRVARERELRPVAVTFDRHPREIFAPGTEPRLLTTLHRKAELVAALGIETIVVLEFDRQFSEWPPEDFVRRVLVDGLHAGFAVVGSNFTFGYKAMGTLATLSELGSAYGFDAEGMSLLTVQGRPVSSSSIRQALSDGDLEWPTEALGRRFVLDGLVTSGAGRGTNLGWPTANLAVPPRMLLPREGVYAGRAFLDGATYTAAINVGTNPTFGGEPLHVEAFLLGFVGEARDRPIALEFWTRIRDEARFDSPEALSGQIGHDVDRTRAVVEGAGQRTP
jgi:riboflavin kinase/FMN adenylyltransferase